MRATRALGVGAHRGQALLIVLVGLFSLGENVDDICSLDDCRIAILWDVFVYTVPEPATVLLALSGVVGLGIAGSRRRP